MKKKENNSQQDIQLPNIPNQETCHWNIWKFIDGSA